MEKGDRAFKVDSRGLLSRACTGDSGGPVMWRNVQDDRVLGDVHSYSDENCPKLVDEGGKAFIPRRFLEERARNDEVFHGTWDQCVKQGQKLNLWSLRSANYADHYIRDYRSSGYIMSVNKDSSPLSKKEASFNFRKGLADSSCISITTTDLPPRFLRHRGGRIIFGTYENSKLFEADATFCGKTRLSDSGGISFESYNYPGHFIRHRNYELWLDPIQYFQYADLYRKDATFFKSTSWANSTYSFRSANYAGYYIRQHNSEGYISNVNAASSEVKKKRCFVSHCSRAGR